MTSEPHDIPGLDEVTRAYRQAGFDEQPPPELDRAIRAAAERAARDAARRSRLHGWTGLAALAATAALAAVVLVPHDDDSSTAQQRAAGTVLDRGATRTAPAPTGGDSAARSGKITLDPATSATSESAQCQAAADDAARWLDCIAALERAGSRDVAARELAAFKARFPAHAIPNDLTALQ